MAAMDRPVKMRVYFRSAITGKFVSKAYAEANPETTIRQAVKAK